MYISCKKRICLSVLRTNKYDLRRSNAHGKVQIFLKSAILKKLTFMGPSYELCQRWFLGRIVHNTNLQRKLGYRIILGKRLHIPHPPPMISESAPAQPPDSPFSPHQLRFFCPFSSIFIRPANDTPPPQVFAPNLMKT